MAKQKKIVDIFLDIFKDDQGKFVIAQKPNLPIIVWALGTLFGLFIDNGSLGRAIDIIALTSIIYWALLEVVSGLNLFRKLLGSLVLLLIVT